MIYRTLLFAVRGAVGACELGRPQQVAQLVGAPVIGASTLMVIRVLGARQLAQAVATQLRTTPTVLASGAAIDYLHAASLIALAIAKPQWRRAALPEAVLASCLAIAGASAAGALPRRSQSQISGGFGAP